MNSWIGRANILFITLDTLRLDVARRVYEENKIPNLATYLPNGWEERHTPGSFTYAAHHAFFAGFLPTPLGPGPHPRLFAAQFAGSESCTSDTFTFQEATLPEALKSRGYKTICIGGTGFFNHRNELSKVLPSLFEEAHWSEELGVTCPDSPRNQVRTALDCLDRTKDLVFLFLNISAIHQPNWFYSLKSGPDTLESHGAALAAVDKALAPLFEKLKQRGPTFCIVCSDHGTAYGEDGYSGHRCGHEVVWSVPYAEFVL